MLRSGALQCSTVPPKAEVTSVVVEFGTLKREEVQRANMAGRWLRYHGAKDPALEQSREIFDRGIAGIGG